MSNHQKERTLVLLKPDAVQRSLVGEIISRFEKVGLKIVSLKIFVPTEKQIKEQYGGSKQEVEVLGRRSIENQAKGGTKIETPPYEAGAAIVDRLMRFMSSAPVVAMILEGNQAIEIVKKLVGATEPLSSDVGTIRGDFTIDSYSIADGDARAVRNIIHRSDNRQEAEKEINIWFKPEEILNYRLINEKILYDVNLDGLLE